MARMFGKKARIYLDYASATPIAKEVLQAMNEASSISAIRGPFMPRASKRGASLIARGSALPFCLARNPDRLFLPQG